jgi:hypothetical protein
LIDVIDSSSGVGAIHCCAIATPQHSGNPNAAAIIQGRDFFAAFITKSTLTG